MMIESSYNEPLDHIRPTFLDEIENEDHLYESLDEISSSQGSISNILGHFRKLPPKALTPKLKRKPFSRQDLRSCSLIPYYSFLVFLST